ncbi:DUF1800 domain-containing protein [Paraburkholderia sp. MMS20-SJTN17]|uniref:DUF1800 domain-containing protein n=1 Tax=Paraburkholderia translucens TaxID=2886945 RepID=A0ABS8KAH4_9BURK|nr:DUF1800 domain-containing protein [Paraburkholderia sp. MMS20-SJTN17]
MDQRREQQKLFKQRYELLRAWWVREMLNTPAPLSERMTLFWHTRSSRRCRTWSSACI